MGLYSGRSAWFWGHCSTGNDLDHGLNNFGKSWEPHSALGPYGLPLAIRLLHLLDLVALPTHHGRLQLMKLRMLGIALGHRGHHHDELQIRVAHPLLARATAIAGQARSAPTPGQVVDVCPKGRCDDASWG